METSSPPDLLTVLWHRAEEQPNLPFVAYSDIALDQIGFLRRVAGAFAQVRGLLGPIGLLLADGPLWMATLLALEAEGHTVVPLPDFFSDDQLKHVLVDAGVRTVVTHETMRARAETLGFPFAVVCPADDDLSSLPRSTRPDARQIVYTSGTTGAPKGAVFPVSALSAKAATLSDAVDATTSDRVLSVLPLSLLLEQIVAMRAPLLVGASVTIADRGKRLSGNVGTGRFTDIVDGVQPSIIVLVPELLKVWVAELCAGKRRAPPCLRFIAVGGAAVAPNLSKLARALGIPVYEGYGLSECGSVVAVNRPGERRSGTVGKPLGDCRVLIDDGEIVVSGTTLMFGYVGGPPVGTLWRTGDLGSLTGDGFLRVHGRRDSQLVLSTGRNISPEWIESLIVADPRIVHCLVLGNSKARTTAIVEPAPHLALSQLEQHALVVNLIKGVPEYACPETVIPVPAGTFASQRLISPNGRIRRRAAIAAFETAIPNDCSAAGSLRRLAP